MKLLLAGGGTGGHLFPAVALAQRLQQTDPGSEVRFVGTERGIEARVLPELGLPLTTIDIAGLVGRGLAAKLSLGPKLVKSLRQALRILDEFRPDVVVGVGGYASAPVVMAARMRGCPVILHEQNAWPGLTNRLLARFADRICLSLPESQRGIRNGRTVVTGNPLRQGMEDCPPIAEGRPLLLVFGGSRGARAINRAVVKSLPLLAPLRDRLEILHQTGSEDLEWVREAYRREGWESGRAVPFIEDMSGAYARAHLVLCRAGATTIAELTACGRPAILVPYPHAAADHQTVNARALARKGAALLLPQQELSPEQLARLVGELSQARHRLAIMGSVAKSLSRPGAADRILKECRMLAAVGGPTETEAGGGTSNPEQTES